MIKRLNPGDLFQMKISDANKANQLGAWTAAGATKPVGVPDHFLRIPAQRYRLHHPKNVQTDHGPMMIGKVDTIGTGLDQVREFNWLPYIPGYVTYTAVPPGLPILTGTMNGCWLVLFTMGGQNWFGHIGTDLGPFTANSIQCKNAWTMALGMHIVTCIGAFNPVSARLAVTGDSTIGALSAHQSFYVIDAHRGLPNPAGPGVGSGREVMVMNTYRVMNVFKTGQVGRPQFM